MLTEAGCLERRDRLWADVPEEVAWVLIGDPRHVQYFCGFRVNPLSFSADQRPLLLLTRDGQAILMADNFLRRACTTDIFVTSDATVSWYTHKKSVINRDDTLLLALEELRPVWNAGTGLIEAEAVSEAVAACVAEQAAWQFEEEDSGEAVTLGDVIRDLRRQKHADELTLLEACMAAGTAGHEAAWNVAVAGQTDLDVYLAIQEAAQRTAGRPCPLYGDFRATRPDRPKAGGLPVGEVLQNGDLLILDFSVVIDGYRSDFTNTISIGEPTAAATDHATACLAALEAAEGTLKSGVSGSDAYHAASAVLEAAGCGPLAHHAGHGLGMEHPEPPILVPESTDVLRCGDVVTLEPGCYIEGVGGMRFEHNYLVTDDGCRRLSRHEPGLKRA